MRSCLLPSLIGLLLVAPIVLAQESPSYARQIQPFFARYCVECHPAETPDGGLRLDTFEGLMTGGDHGQAIVPGKPDLSRLLRAVEGKAGPKMPPKRAKQPKREEIALLRAWIATGARNDASTARVLLPRIIPRRKLPASIRALAYQSGGKLLAAGGHAEVLLIDRPTGEVQHRLGGLKARVTALAFDPKGTTLAVAIGDPGTPAEIRIFQAKKGLWAPAGVLKGHADAIHALAFSPDGRTLASCSYDRLVKLWDVNAGKLIRDLKDHSDAVYGVAFSPDGKLLASGGADRAVKVWDTTTGVRLYTLGESTDWVYAVAWSPEGKYIAAAGVDRSIRVWEVDREGGRVAHSVFAHEAPILRLVYSADGKTLYSLGEDRRCKAWDTVRMVERKAYDVQSGDVLSFAVAPDGRQLALGSFNGSLVLLDQKTGKVQAQPLPIKPKPPVLKQLTPTSGQRGKPVKVILEGTGTQPVQIVANHPGVKAVALPSGQVPPGKMGFTVTFPADTPAGVYQLRLKNEAGESAPLSFTVDLFGTVKEVEPNDSPRTGQKIALPATVVGDIDRAGQVDYFSFEMKPGQEVGAQIQLPEGSKLAALLTLLGPDGELVAEGTAGSLGYVCQKAGTHALGVRDRDYRGGMPYRLHIGDVPVVTAVFPLGIQAGHEAEIQVEGVYLGGVKTVKVKAPKGTAPGTRLPVVVKTPRGTPPGNPSVVVGAFPDVVATAGKPGMLPVDATANGRLLAPGAADTWRFSAKKGETLLLEVEARRLGSPLDSTIEILDSKGNLVPRAVLRCLARTYSTFRDNDSVSPGIRIEAWSELAVNDYLYVGSQLLRIEALPRNPDDDCRFFTEGGKRRGYLGTTPNQLAMGTPMYKVAIHPPGTTFPPNGLPLVTLYYRNDDGVARHGKDSYLGFDPPADGEYQVRITDARGQGGNRHAYRLTLRRPRPDFTVSFSPTTPSVWQGGAVPVAVNVERRDGFEGEIAVRLENLPPGFSAPRTSVPAGENSTAFALYADPGAVSHSPGLEPGDPLKLVARATINGQEVVREAKGGRLKAVPSGEIVTTTAQSAVTVKPGGTTRLTVKIDRRKGFKGRVPLDVRGLPHGVRVLDVGLNGILVVPGEVSRTIQIYCEPWVEPTEHPIVVLARREGKNTEHAARSVLLKVAR
jgi:Planctomycete cytochrome C/WD domain, G-beta repeat